MVINAAYREFFSTVATAAAGLTGLLFVAMSVAPRLRPDDGKAVIQQIRAAAALVGFFNALAVPLFGLVPGLSVRYPATVLGIGGILFTAAGTRTIWSSPATARQRVRQVGLGVLLLLIFGTEFAAGVILLANPRRSTPLELIAAAMVASLLVGVARAWELVGTMDTGIARSRPGRRRERPHHGGRHRRQRDGVTERDSVTGGQRYRGQRYRGAAALLSALACRESARRWRRATARSWLIRAAPASTTRITPQTADSSRATPSGRWPCAPM
jgi:hypothetical protein